MRRQMATDEVDVAHGGCIGRRGRGERCEMRSRMTAYVPVNITQIFTDSKASQLTMVFAWFIIACPFIAQHRGSIEDIQ